MTINVMCVDDSPDIVRSLAMCIASEPDMELVGCLNSADRLVTEVQARHPDVVLLDMRMPGKEPLQALRELTATEPVEVERGGAIGGPRVIAYSGRDDIDAVREAVDAGARGYIAKGGDVPNLMSAIREVARGGVAFEGWASGMGRPKAYSQPPAEPR